MRFYNLELILTIMSSIVFGLSGGLIIAIVRSHNTSPTTMVVNSPALVDAQQSARAQSLVMVWQAKPKLSQARQRVVAAMLTDIADYRLPAFARHTWIALVGLESTYDGKARSRTGAVGMGQLLPHYRADHGRTCGLTDATESDLQDDYTNLTLSACYFAELLRQSDNDLNLAMIAYSAGIHSDDYKHAQAGAEIGNGSKEYITGVRRRLP